MSEPLDALFERHPIFRIVYKGFLLRLFNFLYKGEGTQVMEEEWDNLIILDACRYDYFKEINLINGKLEYRLSLASHTAQWIERNFKGDHPDVVCVSGTPQFSKVKLKERFNKVNFHHVENVWDYGWDVEWETVPPSQVTEAAINCSERYPDKRMIVWYQQPHSPFPPSSELSRQSLGSINHDFREENFSMRLARKFSNVFQDFRRSLLKRELIEKGEKAATVYDFARKGLVDRSKLIRGYKENLEIVLGEVEKLLKELEGKTVITSDHGELFGEHSIYGHPPGLRFKELVEVPWLVVKS